MDIVISELVSNITRDAFENLGHMIAEQMCQTVQPHESICKRTLESIEWPHLTKELILSRPIQSFSSGNELGDGAKTIKKDVPEKNTSQYLLHMIAEQMCQTVQPHESICKSTLESIEWPHLTKELILSRPIQSFSSSNELGDGAKTIKKMFQKKILQYRI
ncbi:hypothetical protein JTE90_019109 [Oedothorax gibbosus]|uniref:Uncharacterized protein n=1 Tax=Oedothorax gibbosus TaxID=931172 RepID=A0AAV6VAV3_9ARAC|nr:hypothetical protein JTE90_019109 [Oedothorax gibbosus]